VRKCEAFPDFLYLCTVEPPNPTLIEQLAAQLPQLLTLVVLFSLSALVSAAESAYMSLTKIEIDEFREGEEPNDKLVWKLLSEPQKLLATILITNNFVNVMAILIANSLQFGRTDGQGWDMTWEVWGAHISLMAIIQVVAVTSVLLFIGEIIPKVYATKNRIALAPKLSPFIAFLQKILAPVSYALISLTYVVNKNINFAQENTSLQELRHAIDLTTSGIGKTAEEKQLLKGIVAFGNIPVRSVMQARVDVIAIEKGASFEAVMAMIVEHGYSRMPVYEESLDKITGILHIKDLLPMLNEQDPQIDWDALPREPYFVPENKKIDTLLDDLKRQRRHLAIVVDEFGGTAGIVTLEDIVEEIFGEIADEFDSDALTYTKKSDTEYIFEGRAPLNDMKRVLHLPDDTFDDARGDNDTLGGLLLEIHGRIPKRGEIIHYRAFAFHIEAVSESRIHQVKVIMG